MDLRLKTIASFLTPEDAEPARITLVEQGIPVCLENATTVGMVWYYGNAVGGVKLQVSEADEQRAREILAGEAIALDRDVPSDRICQKCGERLPPNFEVCWSCQTPVDKESDNLQPPTPNQAEEYATDAFSGDGMAWRACMAAVFGFFTCGLMNVYSCWLLLRLAFAAQPLSRRGRGSVWLAVVFNLALFIPIVWFLSR